MTVNYLKQAQELALPPREEMLMRLSSVEQFWSSNSKLLELAWAEWDEQQSMDLVALGNELLDERLMVAVQNAWRNPNTEQRVRALWEEVAPNVYTCQFFNPEKLTLLRNFLESAWDAKIPMRPPYGIVLNRGGAMLDPRSSGYLAAPSFQTFYRTLIDLYMRPIARMLFPEIMGYDSQSFGFSIKYQPTTDTSIRPHTDASSVTLNINLNLPDESFTGSSVDFFDTSTKETKSLMFAPGSAMIHRGSVPHTALPITSGERTNIVLWLFGERGSVARGLKSDTRVDASARWILERPKQDNFAPF
jgi:hypothetical protein